jgi:hypothetical protein
VTVSLVIAMYRIGWSLGLVFEKVGGDGRSVGRKPVAWEMAVWTSVAAASMFFSSRNCSVSVAFPCVLFEVTSSRPGICMNWRSRGAAIVLATVSGEAPG